MTSRNPGLELFRVLALANAHQWHLSGGLGGHNYDERTFYRQYYVGCFVILGFTMIGLFQIGTLFSARSPFRLRRVLLFWGSLIFYNRFFFSVFSHLGEVRGPPPYSSLYPITGRMSHYFTSHTMMTLMTPILHPGMLGLTKRAYIAVDVGIVGFMVWCGGNGIFMSGNGYNWMAACTMYVFAGIFAVHGWKLSPLLTWVSWALCLGFAWSNPASSCSSKRSDGNTPRW
jgi:hypothetical protein